MNKYYFIFSALIFFSCCKKEKFNTVEKIESNTFQTLNDVKFLNEQIGFCCGGNRYSTSTILKTIDGGTTWHEIILSNKESQKELFGLDVLTNGTVVSAGFGGVVYVSNDTGNSFIFYQHGWEVFHDLCFQDSLNAYLVGGVSFLSGVHSTLRFPIVNVGNSNISDNFEIRDVDFINKQIGFICGYGAVKKTNDCGMNWNFTTAKNDYFKAMYWKNELEGIVVGDAGSICKTSDGGNTWKVIRNGNALLQKKYHLQDIDMKNEIALAVGDDGLILISKNSGDDWDEIKTNFSENLTSVFILNTKNAIAVGENGLILKIDL
ncbi:MAG: hypothetical protein KA275_02235 [Chitinophagaceae bacterium]|nr:hypothetical protein [Chitinophagaceae bacterium]